MDFVFSEEAWEKCVALVEHNKKEVGWFGVTRQTGEDKMLVVDIFVPDQKVCPTEWRATKEAMADMQLEDEVLDYLEEGCQLNYMGHSHVNMGVGPSAQDETYIDFLLSDAPEMKYVLYTSIHNKRHEVTAQASLVMPGLGRMSVDVDVKYMQSKYATWAKEQTEKHVSDLPASMPSGPASNMYGGKSYLDRQNAITGKQEVINYNVGNNKGGNKKKDPKHVTDHDKFCDWSAKEAEEWKLRVSQLEYWL